MSKRFILLLIFISFASLAGCSSKSSEITIDNIISTFSENEIHVDEGNTPLYDMIGASDGVTFKYDNKVVIYVYDSEKDLKKAKKDYNIIKDWPSNGRFMLEAYDEKVIDIFNGIK